jgi:hypothetical protein
LAAILLAALAGLVGALAGDRWLGHSEPEGLHEFVHERLDLSADQSRRLEELERRFAIENAQLELALRRANASLAEAMDSEHQYGPKVTAAIDDVHEKMGDLQKATVQHVFAMREILNERQRREFDAQVARSLTGGSAD